MAELSAIIAKEEGSPPLPLEQLSPIPGENSHDSITAQVGTTDSEAHTSIVLDQIRSTHRYRSRRPMARCSTSKSVTPAGDFLFKDILCAEALITKRPFTRPTSRAVREAIPRWRLARLMFGEECTLPMDIGLPRDQLDTSESITSPYALWVRDALEEAYDQVRQHSVQRQKRLYDRRAVKRDFVVGDWVMRYYSPAKKCKLDSPWIGPYLIVSFMGWTIRIQKEAESPVVMVHCQDVKKIPPPLGAVSWLTSKESTLKPTITVLGASTMHRTMPHSLSMTVGLSVEDITLAGEEGSRAVGPSVHLSGSSQGDVTSATLISVSPRLESDTAELDISCALHPFFVHKMDSGPVRLMTIAHAFNYRMAVLWDGVRSAVRVGRSRKAEKCFLTDVNISWGQQVAVMFQIISTLMVEVPDFASEIRRLQGLQPRFKLWNSPWGHGEQCVAKCDCLMSDLCSLPYSQGDPSRSDRSG